MNLKYGIVEESYKYIAGEYSNENDKQYLSYSEIPGREPSAKWPVKWGRDIFSQKTIALVGGKRDWIAFQVALKADELFTISVGNNPNFSVLGDLNNVRLETKLMMTGAKITKYHVGLMEDDDSLLKSDILLQNEVVTVEKKRVQLIWVEVEIGEETPAGIYEGQIDLYMHKLFEAEKKVNTLTFTVEVKDVLLPKPSEYQFHLDLWQHNSNIARKHDVVLWSDEHFVVMEKYIASIAELGQKAVTVIASEIPWSGQRGYGVTTYLSDLFEYSMIGVDKETDGNYRYNFSVMQRYIDLCAKYGIDKEIEVFGLIGIWVDLNEGYGGIAEDYPDAIRIRYYDHTDGCYKFIDNSDDIKKYIAALEQWFIGHNLIEKVRIIADEPSDIELYRKRLKLVKDAAPSFKFKTAINHSSFIGEFKEEVADFVPAMDCVSREWDLLCEMKGQSDARFLWYVCCVPDYPNTYIKSHLLESRFIGYLTSYMGFDGFLRWNYTAWPERPRERIRYRFPSLRAGETNFVYPANNGTPLLSVRYKNLKRGIEDFELINILKNNHPKAEEILQDIWSRLFKVQDLREFYKGKGMEVFDIISLRHEDYEYTRRRLLEELELTY